MPFKPFALGLAVLFGIVLLVWMLTTFRTTQPKAAAPPPVLDEAALAPVREALKRGNKIEAIKRYRELVGVGLKEAKDAVEAMER